MSEPKLISPMLDDFVMGTPICEHGGVCCCPAIENETDDKYIVKIISTPASQTQLDALLLSGAYSSIEAADEYFRSLANEITKEVEFLDKLSQLEGFSPYTSQQLVPMDDGTGYDVYLLSPYRKTLAKLLRNESMTHLAALNLALDICAALTICRRSGYLYVDLKPENIYIEPGKANKIGDIGFISLESLRFASLPERYRSVYTAPEISDAFVSINTTIDVYALGLILYQVFNDGLLPVKNDDDQNESFVAPVYADYEMAEIILKACDPNPENRWQDPVEMGQAIVAYMQRNGAHDTPIVPVPMPGAEIADVNSDELSDEQIRDSETTEPDSVTEDSPCDATTEESVQDQPEYAEDADGNLSFLTSDDDETAPEQCEEEINYSEVSDDVSDMLQQADELISHDAPDPVVPPEPIDVPIPEPIQADAELEESAPEEESEQTDEEQDENVPEDSDEQGVCTDEEDDIDDEEDPSEFTHEQKPKRKRHWLRNIFVSAFVIIVAAVGFLFYTRYYLQPIDSIDLKEHENGDLTVYISSTIDEDKLTVICSDIYGNQLTQPVVDGKAEFTGLVPDSAYTVEIAIDGFHKLTGDTSAAFTTPAQTNIVQFRAVTGSEDGSAVLTFAIDGPDSEQWQLRYSAVDAEEQTVSFSGHMHTLSGLEIGKEYRFVLTPEKNLNYTGTNEITHVASKIVKASNVRITGCVDGKLTAAWSAPKDVQIASWSVRCYNDSGYDKTVAVTDTSAVFDGVENSSAYTVEVVAEGMSVSERAYAAANSVTITGFKADKSDANKIKLNWECKDFVPEKGWILIYTVDGSFSKEINGITNNLAEVLNIVPGATYTFDLQSSDGTPALGGFLEVEIPAAKEFSGYAVSAKYMDFKMCKRPSAKNWDRNDLDDSDYTTNFKIGEKASFLVKLTKQYNASSNKIATLYVIRDENGAIVSVDSTTKTWGKMWSRSYCELDIPSIPQAAGKYTIDIYFNGGLACSQSFKVTK